MASYCFAKSLQEVEEMATMLVGEIARAGLGANGLMAKPLTTDTTVSSGQTPLLVDDVGMLLEDITAGSSYKYLGRSMPGDLTSRG